ncbi:Ectopic P granules protein 5-like protein [Frankliniella fusca]|uniref:Ectopic P granules protein 5-like protein n=1 Tax=Frankliniella fusca TaxID=407009 RepID=A0AAE1H206_9NEOP|nr:Ectopic P granules protein 5-like protein [Frankliniella fusca]KAK3912150.1 Ectopic P granules protein 5-like protein [Frankliniella fusca]
MCVITPLGQCQFLSNYLSMKSSEENYPSLFMDFTMCVVISDYFCYDYIDTGPYINKALNVEVFHSETDVFPILCAWTRLFSDWSVCNVLVAWLEAIFNNFSILANFTHHSRIV